MKEICLKEKKLKNPFEKFSGEELLEAQKIYEMNKKILQILKGSPEKQGHKFNKKSQMFYVEKRKELPEM